MNAPLKHSQEIAALTHATGTVFNAAAADLSNASRRHFFKKSGALAVAFSLAPNLL